MLGIALDGVAVLLLGLRHVPLVVLQEAPEVVVRVGGAPVEVDGLEVVLLGRVVVLTAGAKKDGVQRDESTSKTRANYGNRLPLRSSLSWLAWK